MKRNVPLRAKVSLRDAYLRKLKARGTKEKWSSSGNLKRKKPLKKISKSHRNKLKSYFALQAEFLADPDNALCVICQARREHGESIPQNDASEIHHYAGRAGRLLTYVPYWRPSCRPCRSWPHDNPALAREYGLIAPAPEWNVFPRAEK